MGFKWWALTFLAAFFVAVLVGSTTNSVALTMLAVIGTVVVFFVIGRLLNGLGHMTNKAIDKKIDTKYGDHDDSPDH